MENELLKLFLNYKNKLDKNAFKEILHYYNYTEYEMALEGFIIEIIINNIYINKEDIKNIIFLTDYYNLKTNSIFDVDIYNKLQIYLNKM